MADEQNRKPGESVREMLASRATEKAMQNFRSRERSPEETTAARKTWNEKIGGRRRKRPWK